MKNTEMLMAVMPLILVVSSVCFFSMGALLLCYSSFLLAIFFWMVVFGNNYKE